MASKVGQIVARGDGRRLIRVYLGRDQEIKKRKSTIEPHGLIRKTQAYLATVQDPFGHFVSKNSVIV